MRCDDYPADETAAFRDTAPASIGYAPFPTNTDTYEHANQYTDRRTDQYADRYTDCDAISVTRSLNASRL